MWLGMPPDAREDDERTLDALAKKLGHSAETLSRWKKDPYVQDITQNALKVLGGNRKLAIIKAMMDKAEEGSFQHQRLYFEWQGDIGPRKAPSGDGNLEFTVSINEKQPKR